MSAARSDDYLGELVDGLHGNNLAAIVRLIELWRDGYTGKVELHMNEGVTAAWTLYARESPADVDLRHPAAAITTPRDG